MSGTVTVDQARLFASAGTLAYDPRQRRGPDGKWIKIGLGVATAPGPVRSEHVRLPPQPRVKVAPRGSMAGQGSWWTLNEDLAERASHFWQGRFSDQRAIRQVFRNIAQGKEDPVDGLNLDTNPNWDLTYFRVDKPVPRGVSWEQWEAEHPHGDPVFDREDLRNDLVSAARWLHQSLAAAPVSRQPLYRGLRMKKDDLPQVGDEFDADVISWSEDRDWGEIYASRDEDPSLGRVGEMQVVLKLAGPHRSVDLGPELLDEHLTQGRYRVKSITGRGRRRFVTIEEVAP